METRWTTIPDPTLSERHARIGRLLDEILEEVETTGHWCDAQHEHLIGNVAPLLAFARSEWSIAFDRIEARNAAWSDSWRDECERQATEILARLESALAPLLEGQ